LASWSPPIVNQAHGSGPFIPLCCAERLPRPATSGMSSVAK
jgi:hypothetical protein